MSDPVTLSDVLDALNVFNKPRPSEGCEPWTEADFISVKHLPDFINTIAAAWFSCAQPAPAAMQPLPDHDNHHNALKCPYCNPRGLAFAEPAQRLTDAQITLALQRAYSLGQTYWQQADSDYTSEHRKAAVTHAEFKTLIAETIAAAPKD